MSQVLNGAGPGPYVKTCYTERRQGLSEHIQAIFIRRGAIVKGLGFWVIKTAGELKEVVAVKMYVNKSRHDIFAGDIDDFVAFVFAGSKFDPAVAHNNIGAFNAVRFYYKTAFEFNCLHINNFRKMHLRLK